MSEVVDLEARKEAGRARGSADIALSRIEAHEESCAVNQKRIEGDIKAVNIKLWGIALLIVGTAIAQMYHT